MQYNKKFIMKLYCLTSLLAITCASFSSLAQSYNYYYGNIHAHSSFSDGCKDDADTHVSSPADCYKFAKQSEHLDFFGLSEHNHSQAGMKLANYAKGIADANKENEDGKFVCLYGMEFGVIKNGGHVLVYGPDKLLGWEQGNYDVFVGKNDYSSLFSTVAGGAKSFATLAHPDNSDYGNLLSLPYSLKADQAVTGVALSSGPAFSKSQSYTDKSKIKYYSYYKKLLSMGYIVGPTMDHDNHYTTFGRMSPTRTVLLAGKLTRDSIIEAYRSNRFYASEDWNVKVNFTANGKPLGSYLKNTASLQLNVVVNDDDANDEVKKIRIFYGKPGTGIVGQLLAEGQGAHLEKSFTVAAGEAYYYYVDIEQMDGDRIVTSPIWASNVL